MFFIETGPEAPVRRPRKSGGFAQAIAMILAWVGGAGAAAAAAFWILQYIKPDPAVENVDVQRTADRDVDDQRDARQRFKPKIERPDNKSKPNQDRTETNPKGSPKAAVPAKIDRRNFQRPEMPGLVYRYFERDSFGMKDFSKVAPSRSGVIASMGDLAMAKKAKGLQLVGYWQTLTDQPCDFVLDSTNGARLWIDDQLVLDNTNQFQSGPVKATRTISPGVHKVRADFVLKTQGGTFKLDVAGAGDSNRMNLDQLMRPFEATEPSSLESLQYELAKYPKSAAEINALIGRNRKAVVGSFVEAVPEIPVGEDETAKTVLPSDGRLLAGLAVSDLGDRRVAGVKPIYLSELGLSIGETIGQEVGQWRALIAKPGYAVSAVQFGRLDFADDVQMQFMKIGNQSLLPSGAYAQTLAGVPEPTKIGSASQPVIGLRSRISADASLLGIEAVRVLSSGSQMLMVLVNGFPVSTDLKETPIPSEVKKELKKLSKQSASKLSGKQGNAQRLEQNALAKSTAIAARRSDDSEAQFVSLLEARRLHIVAGDFKSAFAITSELSKEFKYDYWKDLLALFSDSVKRAGTSSTLTRKVVAEIDPAIVEAENKFEFEIAGKLAAGGKMLATNLKDKSAFEKYAQQLEKFEQFEGLTKQARQAAKELVDQPDNGTANRNLGVFFLAVVDDQDEAMKYFARSGNEDYQFIAEHDRNFAAADTETALELADCWKRVGKKVDVLERMATARAKNILLKAKVQAKDKSLKDLESGLKNL